MDVAVVVAVVVAVAVGLAFGAGARSLRSRFELSWRCVGPGVGAALAKRKCGSGDEVMRSC